MKSLFYTLIFLYFSGVVFVRGEDDNDAIVVEDDSESDASGKVQTRLFTGNQELDAGLAGLALGVGGALVVGHLLNENGKKQQQQKLNCRRYKRDTDEPSLRFLNFGGGSNNGNHQNGNYCPPGTYPVGNQYQNPPYKPNHYNGPNNYNGPNHSPYYPPTQGPYRQSHQPTNTPYNQGPYNNPINSQYNQGSFNTPYNRPTSGHFNQGSFNSAYNKPINGPFNQGSFTSPYNQGPTQGPYRPYAPSQGYNSGPYNNNNFHNNQYNTRALATKSSGNNYKVPTNPVKTPIVDSHESFFQPRSNLKSATSIDIKDEPSTAEKLNGKENTDAVKFII